MSSLSLSRMWQRGEGKANQKGCLTRAMKLKGEEVNQIEFLGFYKDLKRDFRSIEFYKA